MRDEDTIHSVVILKTNEHTFVIKLILFNVPLRGGYKNLQARYAKRNSNHRLWMCLGAKVSLLSYLYVAVLLHDI